MRIICQNLWTFLEGTVPSFVDDVVSYMQPGYFFSDKYKRGFWNGRVSFLKKYPRKELYYVPSGFITRIIKVLEENGWHYTLEDERDFEAVEPMFNLEGGIELYDYQKSAVTTFLTHQRGIIKIATGGGKTEQGAACIRSINKPTIFFTNRRRLLHQTHERLQRRLGCRVGRLGDGYCDLEDVTVAMVQTSAYSSQAGNSKVLDYFKKVKFVIGDEIHHLSSQQWSDDFLAIEAPWRLGLSATPCTSGPGLALIGMVGDILVDIPTIDLICKKRLVPPRIWLVRYQAPKLEKKIKWQTVYKLGITECVQRNEAIKDVAKVFKQEGKPTLTLVQRINHGEMLTDLLNFYGVKTAFIRGSVDNDDRDDIFQRLFSGRLHHVVGMSQILSEGVDLPPLRAIINATGSRGGGNKMEDEDNGAGTIQILGRGLRTYQDKKYCDYVDFIDNSHKSLKDSTKDRIGTLESEGFAPFMGLWDSYNPGNDKILVCA